MPVPAESRQKPGFAKVRTTIRRWVWRHETRENPQMHQSYPESPPAETWSKALRELRFDGRSRPV